MTNYAQDIHDFHAKFNLPQRVVGTRPSKKLLAFRLKFLMEELDELAKALKQDDLVKALDALVDLVYVAIGTAHMLSLPFDDAWALVQEANMLKVRATDPTASTRGSDLDVVKPIGWTPPNIAGLLQEADVILKKGETDDEGPQLDLVQFIEELNKAEAA